MVEATSLSDRRFDFGLQERPVLTSGSLSHDHVLATRYGSAIQ